MSSDRNAAVGGSVHQAGRDGARGAGAAAPLRMVTLTLLAHRDYLALARASVMHVAAVLDLPLPRVSDLRLAVDEACTSFLTGLPGATHGHPAEDGAGLGMMELAYDRHKSWLQVTVTAPAPPDWPQRDELGWAMLQALVGEVRVDVRDGVGSLTLVEPLPPVMRPGVPPGAPPATSQAAPNDSGPNE